MLDIIINKNNVVMAYSREITKTDYTEIEVKAEIKTDRRTENITTILEMPHCLWRSIDGT